MWLQPPNILHSSLYFTRNRAFIPKKKWTLHQIHPENHADMFLRSENTHNTRQETTTYREFTYRSKRFYNSPLCYLTRLLNKNPVNSKQHWTQNTITQTSVITWTIGTVLVFLYYYMICNIGLVCALSYHVNCSYVFSINRIFIFIR